MTRHGQVLASQGSPGVLEASRSLPLLCFGCQSYWIDPSPLRLLRGLPPHFTNPGCSHEDLPRLSKFPKQRPRLPKVVLILRTRFSMISYFHTSSKNKTTPTLNPRRRPSSSMWAVKSNSRFKSPPSTSMSCCSSKDARAVRLVGGRGEQTGRLIRAKSTLQKRRLWCPCSLSST